MSAKLSQLVATPSPDPDDLMYIVRPIEGANGSKQITNDNLFSTITRNIADKTVRFDPPATTPPLSAAGQAALYYAQAQNRLLFSENGGAYRAVGDVSGPNAATFQGIPRFQQNNPKQLESTGLSIDNSNNIIIPDGANIGKPGNFIQFSPTYAAIFIQLPLDGRPGYVIRRGTTNTSTTDAVLQLQTEYNQTGDASSKTFHIVRLENSLGSGTHDFIYGEVFGQNEKFRITNNGHFISGRPSTTTGRFTAASAQSPNTQSFEAADTPQSTLVYKWPANDPQAGQVLSASAPVAGVVQLSWITLP